MKGESLCSARSIEVVASGLGVSGVPGLARIDPSDNDTDKR